jgi:energy-coupling factor transporter ATP-binding protein EcfA2
VNFTADDDWYLFIGWLVAALNPNGPFLILELLGEQGSGKSTVMDLVRGIIDPNKASRRSEPRDPRDLMIAASNNRVVSLDNLSGLPAWLSDGLCRLSTGGAFGTRQLFTDEDEVLFEAQRPLIMNGISAIASRPDLLDRSITLTLPTIPSEERGDEREFWEGFHAVSGQILGALCDAVVGALAARSTTRLASLERMADAVLWVTAAESVLGWESGSFQRAYQLNRKEGDATALEASIIYSPLIEFLESQPEKSWEGTATELLNSLAELAGDKKTRQKTWPTSPRHLRAGLERIVPNLRNVGVRVVLPKGRTKGQRNITLQILDSEGGGERSSTSSTSSKPVLSLGKSNPSLDGRDDVHRQIQPQSESSRTNEEVYLDI